MTDDNSSGSTSNRSRSWRAPVIIDQEPKSSRAGLDVEAESQMSESSVTLDKPLNESVKETSTADEADTQSEVLPSATRSSGIGALLLAVIAGGVAGAAVTGLMPVVFPPADNLDWRLTSIERPLAVLPAPVDPDSLLQPLNDLQQQSAALGGRVSVLEKWVESQAQSAPEKTAAEVTTLQEHISRIDGQLAGLTQELAATIDSAQVQSEQKALAERLSDLEASVKDKLGEFDAARVASELSRLGTRLTAAETELLAVERKVTAAEALSSERLVIVARIAVLERLRVALEQGRPFTAEIDTLVKLGVSGASVSALEAAANGIATPQSLAETFASAAAVSEAEVIPPDASFMDKLAASAFDLVRIRRVDGTPDASDLAGQVELFLKSNDASASLSAWERLPQLVRDKTRDIADALHKRVDAQAALEVITRNQMHALGATAVTGTPKGE